MINLGISTQARYDLARQKNEDDILIEDDFKEIDRNDTENEFILAWEA